MFEKNQKDTHILSPSCSDWPVECQHIHSIKHTLSESLSGSNDEDEVPVSACGLNSYVEYACKTERQTQMERQ